MDISRNIATLHHPKTSYINPTFLMNFEDISSIEELETVSAEVVWQHFERLAGFIFEKNDFTVKINTVKTCNKKRRQYDVIARKNSRTFLVECKKWAGSRYRLSALKRAIVQHKERTTFYEDITDEDAIPVIVTLIEEQILVHEGVPLVPIIRLNAFISELDAHTGEISFSGYEAFMPQEEDDLPADNDEFSAEREGEQ
jgi:hypothetical protein